MSTHTTMATLERLSAGFWGHVRGCGLPAPLRVDLDALQGLVSVQTSTTISGDLGALLVWAYSLEAVTAEWWHTKAGNLHITINGRAPVGTMFQIYGGIPFASCTAQVNLATGKKETVSLDELYTLAGLLTDTDPNSLEGAA